MIFKLFIEDDGIQKIIEVDTTGGYYDPSKVIWDERRQGPFPPENIPQVGGLTLGADGRFTFDQGAYDRQVERLRPRKEELRKKELKELNDEVLEALAAKEEGDLAPLADVLKKRDDIKKKYQDR